MQDRFLCLFKKKSSNSNASRRRRNQLPHGADREGLRIPVFRLLQLENALKAMEDG
jgi:hypothetical protein